jgi:hypothetical protein
MSFRYGRFVIGNLKTNRRKGRQQTLVKARFITGPDVERIKKEAARAAVP